MILPGIEQARSSSAVYKIIEACVRGCVRACQKPHICKDVALTWANAAKSAS
jgi:hypothetical protein